MPNPPESPWRPVFEQVRALVGKRRDEQGVLGSINWLRAAMSERGANPNVVRNIIYRDKGKLADKRALYDILKTLWALGGDTPLQAPELEALLAAEADTEQDVQLLGREKRRVYSQFVSGVRAGQNPKLLVSGRPGSGKTLLLDYVQQALELPPQVLVVRLEFGADLGSGLTRLAVALGLPRESVETKLVKAAAQSAFAVQADAQAEVARSLLDAVRARPEPPVLLLHLSQSLSEQRSLGVAPLRLHTPDVPRVSAAEWLWLSLLEPLSRLPVSLLVSTANLPLRAAAALGGFEDPVKLNPPTVAEARRFVSARLPQLESAQQEAVVQRSGRSFEELRTVTLLAELREPLRDSDTAYNDPKYLDQLGDLLDTAGDERLRDFLSALAVVSLPDATFSDQALAAVRTDAWSQLNGLEAAFLDPVPGREGVYRPFSRQFARTLQDRFQTRRGDDYRSGHRKAATFYELEAHGEPGGEAAVRYLHHLFEARDWDALYSWLQTSSLPQTLLHRLWSAAESELYGNLFEGLAVQVAVHYVRLGSYTHPDALRAFEVLERSDREDMRLWTLLKRAEGAVLKGRIEVAETLLQGWTHTDAAELNVEHALLQASLARWRSDLCRAAELVDKSARPLLSEVPDSRSGRLVRAKVAVWAGLIAKDRGDLAGALHDFGSAASADDLVGARIAFQRGDALLQLGRFDAALAALDEAVGRARRSEALAQEQARYLARRGNVQRLRGQLAAAAADFEQALSGLAALGDPLERAFWQAKVEDERALLTLAQGEFDAAILLLHRNRAVFTEYAAGHGVDVAYRSLRNGLRTALAYGLRGLAQPYRLPFGRSVEGIDNADLRHARRLLRDVGAGVAARFADRAAYETLQRDTLLVETLLAATPSEALAKAERGVELARFDHQEGTSQAFLAAAHLRTGQPKAAAAATERGHAALERLGRHGEPEESGASATGGGDLGLRAWLHSLELQAWVAQGEVAAAVERVATLQNPHLQTYREPLLRALGESLEAALGDDACRHPAVTRVFGPALADPAVRLPDALVAGGEKLSALVVTAV